MPRIGIGSISRSISVGAIHPLYRVGPASGRLRRACQQLSIAIMATAVALASTACKGDSSASTRPNQTGSEAAGAREVRVTPVIHKPMERSTIAVGSLAAFDQATVSIATGKARCSIKGSCRARNWIARMHHTRSPSAHLEHQIEVRRE